MRTPPPVATPSYQTKPLPPRKPVIMTTPFVPPPPVETVQDPTQFVPPQQVETVQNPTQFVPPQQVETVQDPLVPPPTNEVMLSYKYYPQYYHYMNQHQYQQLNY